MAKNEKKNKISKAPDNQKEGESTIHKDQPRNDAVKSLKGNNFRAILVLLLACLLMLCFCFISYKVFFGSSDLYSSTDTININGLEKLNVPDSSIIEKSPGL